MSFLCTEKDSSRAIVQLKLDAIQLPFFNGELTTWEAFRPTRRQKQKTVRHCERFDRKEDLVDVYISKFLDLKSFK